MISICVLIGCMQTDLPVTALHPLGCSYLSVRRSGSLRRAWRLLRRLDSTVEGPTSAEDGDRACYCADNHRHLYTLLLQHLTNIVCLCATVISNKSTYLLDRPCFLLYRINQMKQNGSWCKSKLLCVQ